MAVPTRLFGDPTVVVCNSQVFGVVAGRKSQGVKESVSRLAVVFGGEVVVRGVAVVAGGKFTVRRFYPGIQMLLHHVAVCTGLGIVLQVRGTARVAKRIRSDSCSGARQNSDDDTKKRSRAQKQHPAAEPGRRFVLISHKTLSIEAESLSLRCRQYPMSAVSDTDNGL